MRRFFSWVWASFTCMPLSLLFLTSVAGCSSLRPHPSSLSYSPPSSAPVRQKITAAQTHATAAKSAIARAIAIASRSQTSEVRSQKSATDLRSLTADLGLAGTEVDALTTHLLAAATSLTELDAKVSTQTSQLNAASDDKNVALARADKIDAQRRSAVAQRNKLLFLVVILTVWIFRGPLLSGAGFIARKFIGIPI